MTRPQTPAGTAVAAPILAAADYARRAAIAVPPPTFAYVEGGAGAGLTARRNRRAFDRWAIMPRLLRAVGEGHTSRVVAGQRFTHPILLAPVAYQALVHPEKEIATARAARATDTRMVLSTLATTRLEDVAHAGGAGHWFQLYLQPTPAATLALARRARDAGYAALVVTLDAGIQVAGHAALRAGFTLPAQCVAVNLEPAAASHGSAASEVSAVRGASVRRSTQGQGPGPAAGPMAGSGSGPGSGQGTGQGGARDHAAGSSRVFQRLMRAAPLPADLEALIATAELPVWVKGVMTPGDAMMLRDLGVAGIVVSNHGGRTLDGVPASLDVLPAIRAAVGPGYPVFFDGGIRSGADVFKALALGAQAALVGRLQMHALAVGGAVGVGHLLNLLREELELCMAAAGCATVDQIGPDCLLRIAADPDAQADLDEIAGAGGGDSVGGRNANGPEGTRC